MDTSMLSDLGPAVWLIGKFAVILGLGIYSVFAFVIVRQVTMMTKTLQIGLEPTLKVFAFLHFFLAIGLILISIFIL